MSFDPDEFYAYLRSGASSLFGTSLSQRQVDGINALLDAGAGLPVPHMANCLSQTYRETGGGMYPVKETVYRHSKNKNPSDALVIRRLDSAWKKGQLPWVKKPYWRDGMFGRGQIQITHEYNYRKGSALVGVDLVKNPSLALELTISAMLAVRGMATGLYTNKKLADYNSPNGYRHNEAREIVNGDRHKTDRGAKMTVGQEIEKNALAFERALKAAGWSEKASSRKGHDMPKRKRRSLWSWLRGAT